MWVYIQWKTLIHILIPTIIFCVTKYWFLIDLSSGSQLSVSFSTSFPIISFELYGALVTLWALIYAVFLSYSLEQYRLTIRHFMALVYDVIDFATKTQLFIPVRSVTKELVDANKQVEKYVACVNEFRNHIVSMPEALFEMLRLVDKEHNSYYSWFWGWRRFTDVNGYLCENSPAAKACFKDSFGNRMHRAFFGGYSTSELNYKKTDVVDSSLPLTSDLSLTDNHIEDTSGHSRDTTSGVYYTLYNKGLRYINSFEKPPALDKLALDQKNDSHQQQQPQTDTLDVTCSWRKNEYRRNYSDMFIQLRTIIGVVATHRPIILYRTVVILNFVMFTVWCFLAWIRWGWILGTIAIAIHTLLFVYFIDGIGGTSPILQFGCDGYTIIRGEVTNATQLIKSIVCKIDIVHPTTHHRHHHTFHSRGLHQQPPPSLPQQNSTTITKHAHHQYTKSPPPPQQQQQRQTHTFDPWSKLGMDVSQPHYQNTTNTTPPYNTTHGQPGLNRK